MRDGVYDIRRTGDGRKGAKGVRRTIGGDGRHRKAIDMPKDLALNIAVDVNRRGQVYRDVVGCRRGGARRQQQHCRT